MSPRRPPPPQPAPPPPAAVEAALRDPATLWDAVRRTAGDFITIFDRAYAIRLLNRASDGFALEDVVGGSVLDFMTDDSREPLRTAIDEVFRSGVIHSLQTKVRAPDGTINEFAVQLGPVLHGGDVVAVIACSDDITAFKRAEQDVRRERHTLRRLIDIQERERQLVSYEIHDGLAQYIAGAIMHLEAHLHAREGESPGELVDCLRLMRAAAEESRRLIGGLRPPALDELGIVEAIESLVADARIEIPQVTFRHALPEGRLPAEVETAIFRIVQESLTNVRRHAEARSAEVVVEVVDGGVHVRVTDDGRGFDPAKVSDDRFGLEGMRQRCRLAGVEPLIDSAPGRGTAIDVVLPFDGGGG
jgi:PAS domain S-box-containing protein